jgi:prolipoprotein diacylglyceryl transferase
MSAIAFTIGPLTVRWYGILIVSGIILAVFISWRLALRHQISFDYLLDLALAAVPLGLVGARLYYVAFNWPYYSHNPEKIIAIWHGGLAIHGAILAGALVLFIMSRKQNVPFRLWADIITPGLILAQAIGRWGNFFNQEAYGYETDLPWAMFIDGAYRHPTFLYESIWDALGFSLLLFLTLRRPRTLRQTGDIAACYLIFYSCGRFCIEHFRTDSLMLGPLQMAQVISIIGIAAGLLLLYCNRRWPAPDQPTPGR